MDNDLGEFVGKGFAMLRDRLKLVEAREALNGIDGDKGDKGDKGDRGDSVTGDRGDKGESIKGDKGEPGLKGDRGDSIRGKQGEIGETIQGDQGDKGEPGKRGKIGLRGLKGDKGEPGESAAGIRGNDGDDGNGIQDVEINKRGHLIITLDDGRKIDAGRVKGKDAVQFQGMIAGGPSSRGNPSGIATLEFGASNKTATVVVTGIDAITATSVVLVKMRIEDTDDHIAEDLLIDPIRVEAFAIVPGVGFTIYGTMKNAPANGKYNVQWALV
jgi:hypothetical protein